MSNWQTGKPPLPCKKGRPAPQKEGVSSITYYFDIRFNATIQTLDLVTYKSYNSEEGIETEYGYFIWNSGGFVPAEKASNYDGIFLFREENSDPCSSLRRAEFQKLLTACLMLYRPAPTPEADGRRLDKDFELFQQGYLAGKNAYRSFIAEGRSGDGPLTSFLRLFPDRVEHTMEQLAEEEDT